MVASKEKLIKIKNQIILEKLKDIKNIVLLKILFSTNFYIVWLYNALIFEHRTTE